MIELLLKSWYLVSANPLMNCIFKIFRLEALVSEVIVHVSILHCRPSKGL